MKRLEDIMKYYNLKDDTIIKSEVLSDDEKSRILQKTMTKAGLIQTQNKSHSRKFIWLIAACITIFALGAVSFASTTLNGNFLNFFNPQNQEETNLLNSLGTIIDKQVTENGLTIDIKEALGDSNAVYVMFDIIAPEGVALDNKYYTFTSQLIDIEKGFSISHGMGYTFKYLEDTNPNDNIKSMMLCLSSSEKLVGKNMTFKFKDFSTYKTEDELKNRPESYEGSPGDENDIYNILIPGNWEITFPLNYIDNTTVYKLNQKIQYNDISFKIKEVRLSPISISITLSTFSEVKSNDIHNAPLIIHMKNNETINANDSSRGTSSSLFSTVVDAQFNKTLIPSEIESIEYCGTILNI